MVPSHFSLVPGPLLLRRVAMWLVLTTVVSICIVPAHFGCLAMRQERGLQAVFRTEMLLETFVAKTGRWPASWTELKSVQHDCGLDLSRDTPLEELVAVNYSVTVDDVLEQRAAPSTTIRPLVESYPHTESVARCLSRIRDRLVGNRSQRHP